MAHAGVQGADAMISSRSPSGLAGDTGFDETFAVAVRWYLRYGLSYRRVEELRAGRGIDVDHVTIYGWVRPSHRKSSTPTDLLATLLSSLVRSTTYTSRAPAAGPPRTGRSTKNSEVVDVPLSEHRDAVAARAGFA
jgi:hypothetical protein